MLHDQHLHTSYSGDSRADIDKYYEITSRYNCKYFVSTDHIEFDSVYNGLDWTVDYPFLKEDLKRLHKEYPNVTPLLGVEIGYRKDKLKEMDNLLASQEFDLINLSVHDNGIYDYYMRNSFETIGINRMLDIYFNNVIDALNTYDNFDVLSHFDYGFKTAYLIDDTLDIEMYKTYVLEIFKKVIAKGKTLEINVKVQHTINDDNHLKTWLKWYYDLGGVNITLSSDSHEEQSLIEYYDNQKHYFDIIKSCGFKMVVYFVKRQLYKCNI